MTVRGKFLVKAKRCYEQEGGSVSLRIMSEVLGSSLRSVIIEEVKGRIK